MVSAPVTHPALDDANAWVTYRYIPSLAAAVIFIIIFGLLTTLHIVKMVKLRSWFFVPFVLGGIMEVIGYIGRCISHGNIWSLGAYIIQSILLLIAPAFFAATIYMTLKRIIVLCAAYSGNSEKAFSRIPTKWISRIFVWGDVFAFLLQAGGGGIQGAGTLSSLKIGEDLIIAGLFVQIIFFGFFMVTIITFHRRANGLGLPSILPGTDLSWRRFMYMLYGASGLILVRSVFRVVEYLMGNDGFLLRHEYFLYIFDAVLMSATMAIVAYFHPGEIAPLVKNLRKGGQFGGTVSPIDSAESGMRLNFFRK